MAARVALRWAAAIKVTIGLPKLAGIFVLLQLAFVAPASAAPAHPFLPALTLTGTASDLGPSHPASPFNQACGVAVDSEGDVSVASADAARIDVFGPDRHYLTSIANANGPCGLAVDSQGNLYVSESGTGNVVRYTPSAYPFVGAPTYGAPTTIDSSGLAEGIAVDPFDDRLYVAKGGRIDVFDADGSSAAVSEVHEVSFFSPSGGTFRLAMPADGAPGRNEIQWVRRANNADGNGTFTLEFDGQTTAAIPQEATAAQVKAALEALPAIGAGNVNVTGFPGVRGYWVEFTGALVATDVPLIEADGEDLEDPNKTILVGAFSDVTGPIPFGATAAEVESQLEGLDSIGVGNVDVEKPGSNYLVTFTGALANTNVGQLAGDGTGLENTSWSGVAVGTIIDGFSGKVGEGDLAEASGVAVYTYGSGLNVDRYLFVADADGASADKIRVFGGDDLRTLQLRAQIEGVDHDANPGTPLQKFGFGSAGAHLAADPGSCPPIDNACAAGHFFFYDDASKVVDEFEATGQYLTQIASPDAPFAFEDAEPTAIAVDRSGGAGDGALYVTAGAGAGAKALAFGPLAAPSRSPRENLSFKRENACAAAVDSHGNRYVAADSTISVYPPSGSTPLTTINDPAGPCDLAVDSLGNVWVLDQGKGPPGDEKAVYFTPASFPPQEGTKYGAPTLCATSEPPYFPADLGGSLMSLGIDPSNDHVFVNRSDRTIKLDSADNGCAVLDSNYAAGFNQRTDIAVHGASGNVYLYTGNNLLILDEEGQKTVGHISGVGSPNGLFGSTFTTTMSIAVDQENGHLLIFRPERQVVEEYEASGAFVAQFESSQSKPFEASQRGSGLAVDNGAFSPNKGHLYLAYDDPNLANPHDLTAYEPLVYGGPPSAVTGAASAVGEGVATLNGTVNPSGVEVEDCEFAYIDEARYLADAKTFASATFVPCVETRAAIGKGKAPVSVHAEVTGLDLEQRYFFRLLARNKYGESAGKPALFGPPLIATGPAHPAYTEAMLRASIDPSGLETTYRFEYGTSEAYGQTTGGQTLAANASETAIEVPIFGLEEGAVYHFRLLAENDAKAVAGPDRTFKTRTRVLAPSCTNEEFRTGRSAALPDCRAYELVTPADTRGARPAAASSGAGARQFNNWLTTPRGQGAGESVAFFINGISLPNFDGTGRLDGYSAIRGEGAHPQDGWKTELTGLSYLQAGGGSLDALGVAADQRYWFWKTGPIEALEGTLAAGAYLRTPSGMEAVGQGSLAPFEDLEADGRFLSPGASHVIFESDAHLEPGAPPASTTALYDRSIDGPTHVVSLKPDGSPFAAGEDATYLGATEDGSAVAFEAGGSLYVRRNNAETVKVTVGPFSFAGLASDGSRVFYADKKDNDFNPGALYAFDLDSETASQIGAASRFVNVSADGSTAYFTSKAQQEGEGAAGQDNLFQWDGAGARFVAALEPADLSRLTLWSSVVSFGDGQTGRALNPSRSTPDGEVLIFESRADLTPYESNGHVQVYRYDAGENVLSCVSCDPAGAAPSAGATLQTFGEPGAPTKATTLVANVTDDGRAVFFESKDALLPEDANTGRDVYEWKAFGEGEAGDCEQEGGCLALISSGQGEEESYLYGMSADGHDVFFTTSERLHGKDIVGSPSIYDARLEGGIPDPPAEEACLGDACRGQGSLPPGLSSPASSGSGAAGSRPARPRCAKGKRRVVRRGKARCVKKRSKRRVRAHGRERSKR